MSCSVFMFKFLFLGRTVGCLPFSDPKITGILCFRHNVEKLCNLFEGFMEKT